MWNFLVGLLILLVAYIIFGTFSIDVIKQAINKEKKRLAREKEKLLARQKIKERLRALLLRKFKWRLYLGYCGLLVGFASLSVLASYVMNFGLDISGLASGALMVEIAILLISLFAIHKSVEFKHVLNTFAPYLKKKVFGKDVNIDAEIEETKTNITEIEENIQLLDRIILA